MEVQAKIFNRRAIWNYLILKGAFSSLLVLVNVIASVLLALILIFHLANQVLISSIVSCRTLFLLNEKSETFLAVTTFSHVNVSIVVSNVGIFFLVVLSYRSFQNSPLFNPNSSYYFIFSFIYFMSSFTSFIVRKNSLVHHRRVIIGLEKFVQLTVRFTQHYYTECSDIPITTSRACRGD